MKKIKIILTVALISILLAGCSGKKHEISYSYMTAEECAKKLGSLDKYYSEISQKSLDFMTQKKDATVEEYRKYSMDQAQDFTDEEKALLDDVFANINKKMDDAGLEFPESLSITVAKTTMNEALGAAGYTHDTTVFLCGSFIDDFIDVEDRAKLIAMMTHEIFHCMTRQYPQFRKDMYSIINFTVNDEEFEIPNHVAEILIANPDVRAHDSYATFTINGEKKDCYLVFLSKDVFEKPGDTFFDNMYTGLVNIKDGTLYSYEEAEDFYKVMGENTYYNEDPEECLATNFSYAVTYGMEGLTGEGYPTPEIIENIIEYLKKKGL